MNRLAAAAVGLAALGLLAGCTSGGSTATSAPPPPPTTTVAPTQPVPATTSSTPAPTPTSTSSATPVKAGPPDCATADLTVHVLQGGAQPGVELALILFTNKGATTCSLLGHPGVSLRRKGAELVTATYPTDKAAKNIVLKPGGQAQTTIMDYSSCNASLSDTVRIYPPNQTAFVDDALELRGCKLTVDPVEAA